MHFSHILFALSWLANLNLTAAGVAPVDSNFQIRNAAGTSSLDTLYALRRSLSSAALKRDTVFKNSTSVNTSWNNVTLFSIEGEKSKSDTSFSAGIDIVCTTCYIKGTATAQFTVNGNFNVSQAFQNATSAIETEAINITSTAIDYVKNSVESVAKNATTSILSGDFDLDDIDFPPLAVDFDVSIPEIPACDLSFQFDGLELYMELETALSGGATYTLNLFKSKTPIGFSVDSDLLIGVVFSVDLILSVESEIDISTGFHIQLHDGIAINIPMFDHNVSSITFNGGNFEFLPVTVQSSGNVLTALLRVGITAGLDISTPTDTIGDISLGFSAGVVAAVFADVAQFVTNITAAPSNDDNKCDFQVLQEYTMLLGANAGATLALGDHTWGPSPNTQIPLFFTTLAAACAVTGTVSAATTGATITARNPAAKAASSTTTSTEVTYTNTAILCLSSGLLNCPASLQSTSHNTVTKTIVSVVPSGSKATFITAASNTAVTTIPFGTNVKAISSTSGSPVSFVPTSSPTAGTGGTGITGVLNGKTGGVSNKLVIGVSVGVGVPVLIAIIAGLVFFCKRKRSRQTPNFYPSPISEPYTPASSYNFSKKLPTVTVSESRRR
ncbi:hypothetical protein N431DRAFT_563636 [Stipitochalara longipes BDJ]|nr:hypothetical protein N431DRAFT_563636 [Stipitochalara longipes BDJ]